MDCRENSLGIPYNEISPFGEVEMSPLLDLRLLVQLDSVDQLFDAENARGRSPFRPDPAAAGLHSHSTVSVCCMLLSENAASEAIRLLTSHRFQIIERATTYPSLPF